MDAAVSIAHHRGVGAENARHRLAPFWRWWKPPVKEVSQLLTETNDVPIHTMAQKRFVY